MDEKGSKSSRPAPGIGQHVSASPGTGKSRILPWRSTSRPSKRGAASTSPSSPISSAPRQGRARGQLHERIRWFCRAALLIVDEIGYLPVVQGGGNLFFQLVNARYEKGAMILTSNHGFAEWGEVFGDPVVATACSTGCSTMPSSFRSKAPATGCASTPI
jgi:hypothetical protein